MPYCVKCGNQIKEDDKYCSSCGELLQNHSDMNPRDLSPQTYHVSSESESSEKNNVKSKSHIKLEKIFITFISIILISVIVICFYSYRKYVAPIKNINDSPKAAVESYLKAINEKDSELFSKCVKGKGAGDLKQQLLDDKKYANTDNIKADFNKQLDDAYNQFNKKFGSVWINRVQLSQDFIMGEECKVTILLDTKVVSISVTNNGHNKWLLVSDTYDVLFPEIQKMLGIESSNTQSSSNNSSPAAMPTAKKIDFRQLLQQGRVLDLEYGIGDDSRTIGLKWGQPDKTGSFGGGEYLAYLKKEVIFYYDRNTKKVTNMAFLNGYSLYGVLVGGELSGLKSVLGTPDNEGAVSKGDELASVTDIKSFEYQAGKNRLIFYTDGTKVTKAYILSNN